jgi:hypothetical protein
LSGSRIAPGQAMSIADRVQPAQRMETTKIAVRGAECETVLDGKRREVGIRDKVVHRRPRPNEWDQNR